MRVAYRRSGLFPRGTDSSPCFFFFFFLCLTSSQYGSQCPRRDWTTKRLASLSTKRVAEETSSLSLFPFGAAIVYLQIARCIGDSIEKERKRKKKIVRGNPVVVPCVPIEWLNDQRGYGNTRGSIRELRCSSVSRRSKKDSG